jgi:hypothetical protein
VAVVVDALAVEEAVERLERLLEPLELAGPIAPVHPERRLGQGLAGAESEVRATRVHDLEPSSSTVPGRPPETWTAVSGPWPRGTLRPPRRREEIP